MKKIIFGLFVVVLLVGCAQVEEKTGEIVEIFCGDETVGKTKDVDLSCTTDTDCVLENIQAFCSPDDVALPTCGPELICDTDNICKAQCGLFP